ncbi:hypothetical protein CRE_23797 [Caenorhabditis remanei]|uniref:aECM cysteine-cradle domain-containing protein n=1 Tax=Caenorhabditis remanei TaxID=31234 RepID=E3NN69_CAERE|nr:hypothetical protein CRE_23797 [Caenorhabditis remanei]
MTTRLILLLFMAIGVEIVSSNQHSVLERYEERLNSALSKRTGVPRTVKRYKCVEEYVTYDQHGRAVTSYQGSRFTTTMEPPTYRTSGEKEIRRKPAKKVTISINRNSEETTTQMVTSSTEKSELTTSPKPFDEMNDEEADRIIEEMYLKKKESHATESPEIVTEVIRTESPRPLPPPPPPPSPPQQRAYSTSSSSSSNPGMQRYNPVKQNKIDREDSDEDYPSSVYHRRSRKRPYDMSTYDDYDDIPLYRPMRREYRMRRRRPILFSDDFSDDTDFDRRIENSPRQQTTRDLSPLRSLKHLRHIPPSFPPPQYRPPVPPPMQLPISASTNMIHNRMPLPMAPQMRHPAAPPGAHQMMAMPPGLGHIPMPPPPQPLQPIQQQQSMNSGGEDVLKMKPILQANPQEMQTATEESCQKIKTLAKSFMIKDVSKWARSNCPVLQVTILGLTSLKVFQHFFQAYAPNASCELIFHFIDSCRNKRFF